VEYRYINPYNLSNHSSKVVDTINHWQVLIIALPSWGKLGMFFAAWVLLWLPIAIPIAYRINWRLFQPITPQQKLPLLGSLYLIVPLILWGMMQINHTNWSNYGLTWPGEMAGTGAEATRIGIEMLGGIGLSLLSLIMFFGLEFLTGLARWETSKQRDLWGQLIPILVLALWISTTEELLFRGYVVVELDRDYPLGVAIVVGNAIFALLHLLWEQTATLPQIPGLWLMGMVLSYACWLTHDLWLAIGLHAGWIWGLTCLDGAQLITYSPNSDWFTGWNKQPLAGVAGFLCLVLTLLMLSAIALLTGTSSPVAGCELIVNC
jgi:hypothetical protein